LFETKELFTITQKISDKKQIMISKQQTTYALEFFGKAIILLSSRDQIAWKEVGLADMGDPDFREMMKDFHAVVSKHGLRNAKVSLFLPLEDLELHTISGDNPAQSLADIAGTSVEEICFTYGTPNAENQCNALYAYRKTLTEAAEFAAQFGFSTTYFSTRIVADGFSEQPKIYLDEKQTAPLAYWSSVAMVAAVAIGAFSLFYATSRYDIQRPTIPVAAMSASQPELRPQPAKIVMASMVEPQPIVEVTQKTNEINIVLGGLNTEIDLQNFTVSTTAFAPQDFGIAEPIANASLPTVDGILAKPLALHLLSASAKPPALSTTIDEVTKSTETQLILTDAAVPKDANYPRPKRRPVSIESIVTVVDPIPASLPPRPPSRSSGLRSSANTTQAAIAQDLVQEAIKKDTAALGAAITASARAIGTTKRPPLKTSNFRNIVKRAAAKPTTTVTTTTKTVAVSKPTTTKQPVEDKPTRAATTFRKGALSLVGVFGTPSKRSALFRTSTGGYRSVKIGQRVAGWKVVSISESSAKVTKGSRTKTMRLP
jgi:hypothetical protein